MNKWKKPVKTFTKEEWTEYKRECNRRWMEKLKADPERYEQWKLNTAAATKRYRESLK
jgi:hypothetical protein